MNAGSLKFARIAALIVFAAASLGARAQPVSDREYQELSPPRPVSIR